MKTIGIKLADGSFYPVLEEGAPSEKKLHLTTAHNNQTKIMVDLYRSAACSMDDAEYVDSLQIENLIAHPNGEPTISFVVSVDEENRLSARITDSETGLHSDTTITLVSRTAEERQSTDEYGISEPTEAAADVPAEEPAAGDLNLDDMDFDLPDIGDSGADGGLEETDFGFPDDAADEPADSQDATSALLDMDFDFPDTAATEDASSTDDFDFDFPDDTDSAASTASDGGLSFTGLYDKETALGKSASYDESKEGKSRLPLIICILCAIICLIAVLLIFFVIPNMRSKKDRPQTIVIESPLVIPEPEKPAVPEPEPVPEKSPEPVPEPEPVFEAQEDEIVIIAEAEKVVPELPPVAEEKPKDISYKIKWGDTLWDIADTFYKNPWRYKYIAQYNGIKDPDHIVSGTVIIIPAE